MFSYRLRIFTISLLLTGLLFTLAKDTHEHISVTPAAISENLNREVSEIASLVTVRILSDSGSGSGVIIGRNGENYRVLTNNHVVAGNNTQNYTVLTADGQTHIAKPFSSSQFSRLDLALVEFTSPVSYRVVEIGNSHKLAVGDAVFGAGFSNWHWIDAKAIENTRNWGLKAFRLTAGKVGMLPEKSFVEGYQLGYK